MNPQPPFLVIREGKSFWVEEGPVNECSATLQAFREGCFLDACCYDATGGLWPIVSAVLKERPSLTQRLLPWRRVRVDLNFGARCQTNPENILSKLTLVLGSDSRFNEHTAVPPSEILKRLEDARTPAEIIRIARECA